MDGTDKAGETPKKVAPTPIGPVPAHLCDNGRKVWRRMVRELKPIGLGSPDRALLTTFCEISVQFELLTKTLGVKPRDEEGNIDQLWKEANRLQRDKVQILKMLRATPAERARYQGDPTRRKRINTNKDRKSEFLDGH